MSINNFELSQEFLSVEEASELLKTTVKTLYTYLCNSKTQKRNKIPKSVYIKFGRKTLFIKSKLIEWVLNGAEME